MRTTTARWQVVALAAAMAAGRGTAHAQAAPAPGVAASWVAATASARDTAAPDYSADVVIDDSVVDARGVLVETRPQTRYRLSLRRTARGWRTEIAYPAARLFAKGPLADPRSGQRIVIDGDLASGKVYDASGRLIVGAGTETTSGASDAPVDRDAGLVMSDRGIKERRADFVKRFGPSLGRVAGRDRFLASEGDLVTETLVDPSSMLPVEINVVRGGALEHRMSVAYGRMPGGRWYVARTRSEVALPDGRGRRFVSERTHLNVVSAEGR